MTQPFTYRLSLAAVISITTFFAACAHHRDVRPGADGTHHVLVREVDREQAERLSIMEAEDYCDQFKKHAVFVEDSKTKYTGSMDEATRDTVKKASTAAMILGGAGTMGKQTRPAGAVLGTAGTVGAVMTGGKDYQTDMRFKCQ